MGGNSNISSPNIEFEDFLFSLVGEQENGMPISIISTLARLGIDPWREAKRLSELPKDRAIQALGGSIDDLADLHWKKIDASAIAASVIRLLPNHGRQASPRAADDIILPRRVAQTGLSSGLSHKVASLPVATWLVIGVMVAVMTYISWAGGDPSPVHGSGSTPSSYDNPVREEPRR